MRLSIALLTILATATTATESSACCLTDWLCGRTTPYVVGYTPYGYAAGYAPVAATPYASGYAAVPATSVAPATTLAPATTSVLRPALATAPVLSSGAYQVQRPAYYDNPSVYTGRPVTPLRGTGSATSYLGAVNQYPTNYQSGNYQSPYTSGYANPASPGLPLTTQTPVGAPVTALPATTVAPLYPATPPRVGGLGRFFGSRFGTSYRSSYYRAPVTYYRPVTSVNPVTGTTVTVQQPCTSYVQQLQRTPYSSLQVGQPAKMQPSACQTTPYAISPYTQSTPYTQPYAGATAGGIGQVGAVGSSTGQVAVPIPSTQPAPAGYFGAPGYTPNTMPLMGAPGSPAPLNSSPLSPTPAAGGDLTPVDQPRLEGNAPTETDYRGKTDEPPKQTSPTYWQLQEAEDSTAMVRPARRPVETRPVETQPVQTGDPVSLNADDFTGVAPIQAPEDYVSPFRRQMPEAPTTPVTRQRTFEAPPLPARPTFDPSDATSVSNRLSVPVRDAALVRSRAARKPVEPKRDGSWNPIP